MNICIATTIMPSNDSVMPFLYILTRFYIYSHEALNFNELNQHVYLYNNRSVNIDNISIRHFVMPFNAFTQ